MDSLAASCATPIKGLDNIAAARLAGLRTLLVPYGGFLRANCGKAPPASGLMASPSEW